MRYQRMSDITVAAIVPKVLAAVVVTGHKQAFLFVQSQQLALMLALVKYASPGFSIAEHMRRPVHWVFTRFYGVTIQFRKKPMALITVHVRQLVLTLAYSGAFRKV